MMLLPLSGLVYHYTANSSALEKMACAVRYFLRDGVKKKKTSLEFDSADQLL